MSNLNITATLVNQITGLGADPTYYEYQFLLNTSTGTINAGTYDIQANFTDATTTMDYIFQNNVATTTIGSAAQDVFTIPGTYYSLGSAVVANAVTLYNFNLN